MSMPGTIETTRPDHQLVAILKKQTVMPLIPPSNLAVTQAAWTTWVRAARGPGPTKRPKSRTAGRPRVPCHPPWAAWSTQTVRSAKNCGWPSFPMCRSITLLLLIAQVGAPPTQSMTHVIVFDSIRWISAEQYFNIIKIMQYGKNIEYPIIISIYRGDTIWPKISLIMKNLWFIDQNAALYCFRPIQNFTSQCPNICLSWTCTRRQARATLQSKSRLKFIHQKIRNPFSDFAIYHVVNYSLLMMID